MKKYNDYPYWCKEETEVNIAYEDGKFNMIAQGILIAVLQNINCDDSVVRKAYNEYITNREKYDVIRLKMILQQYECKIVGYTETSKKKKIIVFTQKEKEKLANQVIEDLKIILFRFFYDEDEIEIMLRNSNIYELVLRHPIIYYYMNIKDIVDYVKILKGNN